MPTLQADAVIPPPRVWPWFTTLEVKLDADVAVEVHVSTTETFTPSVSTYVGVLYAPGIFHVVGLTPSVDYYVKLTDLGGVDVSDASVPVQVFPL